MLKVEEKGRPKYSKFDKMDTSVLEAILRADFDAPEAERLDVEVIIYISNLLAERQEIPQPDVNKAKEEFFKYYYPLEKSIYDFDDEDDNNFEVETDTNKAASTMDKVLPFRKRLWRKFASAAAVFVIFMFGGTLTAYAFGYDPFAAVARWNDEHFWFEKQINTTEITDILSDYSDVEHLVPKWLPEGYEFENVNIVQYPNGRIIRSSFVKNVDNEEFHICINYKQDLDNVQTIYEKTDDDAIIYDKGGVEHYIIQNSTNLTIVWLSNDLECSIVGSFSVAEAKKIINSLYN
jgi:hypothetical protein